MSEQNEKIYSEETLQKFSYRVLQKMAKSMELPSNVKKAYLIKLIQTKKYCTKNELEDLIQKVKVERKLLSEKKNYLIKISENESRSPMITSTPKRKSLTKRFHIEKHESITEYKPKEETQKNSFRYSTLPSKTSTNGSDRILRSSLLKKVNNSDHDDDNDTNTNNTLSTKHTHKEFVKRNHPVINHNNIIRRPKNNVSKDLLVDRAVRKQVHHAFNSEKLITPPKRPRTLKWISSLWPNLQSSNSNICVQDLSIRQSNGKISKIHALIHKRENVNFQRSSLLSYGKSDVNINSDPIVEIFLPNNDRDYSNGNEHKKNVEGYGEGAKEYELIDTDSLYYNDFDGELACCKELTTSKFEENFAYPNIDEEYNSIREKDITQPLYIETSDEWSKYNLVNNLHNLNDSNEPLLKLATESNSYSTLGTSCTSPVTVDRTSDLNIGQYSTQNNTNLVDSIDDGEQTDDTVSELVKFSQIMSSYGTQYYDYNTSVSSSERSQELGENMSIHDMVDDAIDIIFKDSGYLDGVLNDVRVQCIYCTWAGPQNLLEDHIKNEHSNKIIKIHNNECIIKFTLGHLVQSQLWLSEVVEHGSILYVLCVKYEDPECLMATVAMLTPNSMNGQKGKITIYNKVTGEPYIWEGPIQPLPSNMPHFNDLDGLNLELSTLNLIPNSANLKLVNRELVNDSPTKVVVGQPELNDIHIELLINII